MYQACISTPLRTQFAYQSSNFNIPNVSRDSATRFLLQVFFMNQFPPGPWVYNISAISNFFENSQRYLQLKVHHRCRWHRWQMYKNPQFRKVLIILFGHLWVNSYHIDNFFLQVYFKVSAVWYCSHYLPPVLTTPAVPVVHLDLRISPWIFEKFKMT
jgi:hypothetical protein